MLLGPTGAGKTTLLRLVAGLERADAGRIHIGGRDATHEPPAARDVTFVFQQYSLYPHLTVFDNLAFPLRAPTRALAEAQVKQRVEEVARLVRIDHKLASPATRLSGGEMQRVAIGRALVRRPAVYLMDEPLSSLDAKLRADLRVELKHIQADLGATIVYVTHDQVEAMTMASRIGILDRGRLVQFGTPREIYERPANVYVSERLGQPAINLLPCDALGRRRGAGRCGDRRAAHRAHGPRPGRNGAGARSPHRASGQREPSAPGARRSPARHAGLARTAWAPGRRARIELRRPLYFDASGSRIDAAA